MPTPQVIISPEASTPQLANAVIELQRLLTQGLGIGDAGEGLSLVRRTTGPDTPRPAARLGKSDNIRGSLVEVTLQDTTDLNVNRQCHHALSLPVPPVRPGRDQHLNVRWWVAGIRYLTDNYADLNATGSSVFVAYANGAVGADTIDLRFYTTFNLAASANNRRLVVTLFFIPASN